MPRQPSSLFLRHSSCTDPGPFGAISAAAPSTAATSDTESAGPPGDFATYLFTNANVITLDDGQLTARAVAVTGEQISGIGDDGDLAGLIGPDTEVVDLAGRTLTPGFTDARHHRIGNGPGLLGIDVGTILAEAVDKGLTTIDELYVDQARLDEPVALDSSRCTAFVRERLPAVNEGQTVHELWIGPSEDSLELIHEFAGPTNDSHTLEFTPDEPVADVRVLRVATTSSPSWVAWREVVID